MTAILEITNGTTTIDLIHGSFGFALFDWRPSIADYKGGGVWQGSSISEGRQLVDKHFDNAIETFDLKARNSSQDVLIQNVQDLRRMLEDAADYWTEAYNSTPVYIIAKASQETNTRYAVIKRGRLVDDDGPFRQPFLQPKCRAAMDNLTLIVERGHWQDAIPGEDTCLEITASDSMATIYPLEFDGDAGEIDFGSDASLDDLPDNAVAGKGIIWVDGWVRADGYGESDEGTILRKGDLGGNNGWLFGISNSGLVAVINCPTDAQSFSGLDDFTADGEWHYVAMCYSETAAGGLPAIRTIYLNIDGDWVTSYSSQIASVGNYATEATEKLFAGNCDVGSRTWDGGLGWLRVCDAILHDPASGSFDPPIRCVLPSADDDTLGIWIYKGSGSTAVNMANQGTADGTITDATWGDPCMRYYGWTGDDCDDADCDCDEIAVFVANKQNTAQLTHIYHYDDSGAVYSGNLLGAATPFNLLPAAPADSDIIYFGIDTAIANSGPFCSLIFDLATAATYGAGDSADWEYYDGVTPWGALTVRDDTATTQPFDTAGVNSVCWEQPDDWVAFAVNGVTAYWVRCIITVATGVTTPVQQNRDIYTVTWPYIEIAADQVGGDIDALMRMLYVNSSYRLGATGIGIALMGARKVSRGDDFASFVNISDEQLPTGVSVSLTNFSFTNYVNSSTGRVADYTIPATGGSGEIEIAFGSTVASQYAGKYRLILRGQLPEAGGAQNDVDITYEIWMGEDISVYSSDIYRFPSVNVGDEWIWIDLGEIVLPGELDSISRTAINITVTNNNAVSTRDTSFMDIILLPVDEWSAEFRSSAAVYGLGIATYVDIDSVSHPKLNIRAAVRAISDDDTEAYWQVISGSPATIEENSNVRIHMASTLLDYDSSYKVVNRPTLTKVQRYLSMRGNR